MDPTPSTFPWKRNLVVLWFAQVVTTLGFSFTFPFYPIFFAEVGVDDVERAAFLAGVSGFLLGGSMGLTAPLWGIFGDRYGRRLNIIRSMVLGGVLLVLSGYSQNAGHLLLSRVFIGATSGVIPTIMALVAAHTPPHRLSLAAGATMSALLLGTAMGPLFGGVIFDAWGMRAAFWATGIGLITAAVMVIAFAREDFVKPEALRSPWDPFRALAKLMGSKDFVPILLMLTMLQAGVLMATPAIAGIVAGMREGNIDAAPVGLVFGAIGVAGAASSFFNGWLAGKIGIRPVFIGSAALASVFSFGPYFAEGLVAFTLLIASVSLFMGGLGGLLQGMVAMRTPPGQHGMSFGASQVAQSAGTAIGPLVGGAAVVAFGFRSVFLVNVGVFAAMLLIAVLLLRQQADTPRG